MDQQQDELIAPDSQASISISADYTDSPRLAAVPTAMQAQGHLN